MTFHNLRKKAALIWSNLFGVWPEQENCERHIILPKKGEILLLLPCSGRVGRIALRLYSPQTFLAKMAIGGLAVLYHSPFRACLPGCHLPNPPHGALADFIRSILGTADYQVALLAGFATAPGRRFILLCESEARVALIKAGVGEAASKLVKNEITALRSLPPDISHTPKLLDVFEKPDMCVFATRFYDKPCSARQALEALPQIMSDWASHSSVHTMVNEIPAWQRLSRHANHGSYLSEIITRVGEQMILPVVHHGDVTPWNVRQNWPGGELVVIDWERGEALGMPGWDWIHCWVQWSMLARKEGAAVVLRRVHKLLRLDEFCRYAEETGIQDIKHELLYAYLCHVLFVLRPVEGADQVGRMLEMQHSHLCGIDGK